MAPDKFETNGDGGGVQGSKGDKLQNSNAEEILQSLIADYTKSNPNSQNAFERAQHTLPGGNTRSVLHSDPFPLVIKSARDCYVTSLDNREYVDFLSDFSAGMYGHSHPVIKEAIAEALETGFSLGGVTEKEAQLGELIKKRFPSIELIRFCNSGTEANTMALASAVAFTGRKKVRRIALVKSCRCSEDVHRSSSSTAATTVEPSPSTAAPTPSISRTHSSSAPTTTSTPLGH